MKLRRTPLLLLSLLSSAVLLAACGGKSEADLIASAKANLASRNVPAATIELKNALQKNPNSGEARYLLGRALLDSGDPVAGQVELQKAADLQYNISLVVPALARALLEQGEHRKVIDTYAKFILPDTKAQSELMTTVATAYARNGDRETAEATLNKAMEATPGLPAALLMRARLLADKGDRAGANNLLTSLLAQDAENVEAWQLKGDIALYAEKDSKAALEAYRRAVAAKPTLVTAHANIVEILLADKDTAGAKTQVEAMKKALPNHPQSLYYEGVLAYLEKDFKRTRELAARLVQAAPTNPLALQLAGSAEFQLRNFHQAEVYLTKAVGQGLRLNLARLMLAQIQLRSGQPARAIETLAPLLTADQPPNAEALAIAAEAHLQAGDAKTSAELYARATAARPDDPKIRTATAVGNLRLGRGESALDELASIASKDSGTVADMALISAQLRRGELDAALKAIDALEKKQPDQPLAANLRGRVLVLKKDSAGARASFEKALKLDPRYYPAVASLAALDLVENKPDAARARFEAYLKDDPKHVGALVGLSSLMNRTGATSAEVSEVLQRAVRAEPAQIAPRLRLIEHQLNTRDFKGAMSSAQEALASQPEHPDLLQAMGRVQMATGDTQQAITTFNRLVALKGDAPGPFLALGEAHILRKEWRDAERNLRRALAIKPDLLPAQRSLAGALLSDQRPDEALKVAREAQKQKPDNGFGHQLEGDIEAARRNLDAAVAAYRTSLQKTPATDTAVRLHGVLLRANRSADADRFAGEWEKAHPRDAVFKFHLADLALSQGQTAQAETRYRAVLELQPNNALALNNVAYLMVRQNKPGALDFAVRATRLMPNQAALLDTLALAQEAENQVREAVETQKRAVALAPDDANLRLNLARLLVKGGDKAQARQELQTLEKLGPSFPRQREVGELMKSAS